MKNLLCNNESQQALFLVVAVIVLLLVGVLVLRFVNLKFRINYNHSLYAGGFGSLIAIVCAVLCVLLLKQSNVIIPIAFGVVAAIALILTAIFTFKKCGFGAGLLAMFLQIIFSVACVGILFDIKNRGYYRRNYADNRYVEKKRNERDY